MGPHIGPDVGLKAIILLILHSILNFLYLLVVFYYKIIVYHLYTSYVRYQGVYRALMSLVGLGRLIYMLESQKESGLKPNLQLILFFNQGPKNGQICKKTVFNVCFDEKEMFRLLKKSLSFNLMHFSIYMQKVGLPGLPK